MTPNELREVAEYLRDEAEIARGLHDRSAALVLECLRRVALRVADRRAQR